MDINMVILKHDVEDLKEDIAGLKADMKELTNAWTTLKGTATFLKWFVSIAISIASGYVFLKDHFFK